VARNEDEQQLFEDIHTHARDAHGMDEVPPEVVDAIQDVITEV
jgi:predicted small metal-binding protein